MLRRPDILHSVPPRIRAQTLLPTRYSQQDPSTIPTVSVQILLPVIQQHLSMAYLLPLPVSLVTICLQILHWSPATAFLPMMRRGTVPRWSLHSTASNY